MCVPYLHFILLRVCVLATALASVFAANVSPMNARGAKEQGPRNKDQGRPSNGRARRVCVRLCVCCPAADKSIYSRFICVHKFVRMLCACVCVCAGK